MLHVAQEDDRRLFETPDSIERELILPVARERVWAALTQAQRLGAWFGTQATVDLRPGGAVTFIWADGSSGEQFTNRGVIGRLGLGKVTGSGMGVLG